MTFTIALIISVLICGWLKTLGVKRTRSDWFCGVCGGIANHFGWDQGVVRLVTFLLLFFSTFIIWVYLVAWIILDEEPLDPPPPAQ